MELGNTGAILKLSSINSNTVASEKPSQKDLEERLSSSNCQMIQFQKENNKST